MTQEGLRLLSRFEAAVRAHEMRGAQPPEDRDGIDLDLAEARAALIAWMNRRAKEHA